MLSLLLIELRRAGGVPKRHGIHPRMREAMSTTSGIRQIRPLQVGERVQGRLPVGGTQVFCCQEFPKAGRIPSQQSAVAVSFLSQRSRVGVVARSVSGQNQKPALVLQPAWHVRSKLPDLWEWRGCMHSAALSERFARRCDLLIVLGIWLF
jgi:hypothetical protein